jgi:hypothetical protein
MGPQSLFEHYVALWNEPDATVRRQRILKLWAKDGSQIVEPPQDVRDAATALGMTAALEARGHDALDARVTRAYEEFVARDGYTFRPRGNAKRLGNIVTFGWEMIPATGGEVAGAGLEILLLDEDSRIQTDYQFIET